MQVLCQSGDRRPVHMQHVQDRHGFSRENKGKTTTARLKKTTGTFGGYVRIESASERLCNSAALSYLSGKTAQPRYAKVKLFILD